MRHEEKYICSERQLVIIENRLKAFLPADINQTGNDYHIRSLYFDTADDRMYHESLSGIGRRSKYRLRFYNMNTELFRMERKDSVNNMKQKYSVKVDIDTALSLRDNDYPKNTDDKLLLELYVLQQTEGLHPTAIVDYRRTAFTYPVGNVRITLDKDISCTFRTDEFLDKNALLYPLLPQNKHILEIKYDHILPGYIKAIVDTGDLERVSFSKYANSRSIIAGNGRKEDGYEF
ncbi:MAG: polyphosphate polymerase domain-containing protein [Lachnospiraceae bacterium]|nr:polyphosphate polymerase domain-containing protein [Lachnospiraceae bacterium]